LGSLNPEPPKFARTVT